MILDKLKQKFKKQRTVVSLQVDSHKCTGCRVCESKCKRNVFSFDITTNTAVVSAINQCVGCGKCVEKMCKFGAITLKTVEKL